ncbi:hypothetical protein AB0I34_11545 [Kribbella sp. NPDC050281]|uniref:hypothetical protein n=1 Tax=Kribbella sp. NPDC050281 TaxID=3155515 RepID=UPI00340EE2B5
MTASTLELALTYEHARIRELAEQAHHPAAAHPERRHQTDWFYAIAAQHLAAAEDVLLPHVRRLPDGSSLVTRYVGNAKELERSLRFLKGRQYGDSRVQNLTDLEVWTAVDRLLAEHERLETSYTQQISEQLDASHVNTLTEELLEAEEVAPTRAHPYSPHTGMAGRVVHRMWRLADNAWDSAEGRVVPTKYHVHPKRDSALSHYLYGTAMPDDREEQH